MDLNWFKFGHLALFSLLFSYFSLFFVLFGLYFSQMQGLLMLENTLENFSSKCTLWFILFLFQKSK